jgi:hypothetical protein
LMHGLPCCRRAPQHSQMLSSPRTSSECASECERAALACAMRLLPSSAVCVGVAQNELSLSPPPLPPLDCVWLAGLQTHRSLLLRWASVCYALLLSTPADLAMLLLTLFRTRAAHIPYTMCSVM